jgi:hypothetical protein
VTTWVDVLRFVNLFAAGILVGSLIFEFLVLIPGLNQLPLKEAARAHQVLLGHLPDRFMPLSGMLASISGIALLVLSYDVTPTAKVLYAVGTIAVIVLIVGTFVYSRPINKVIADWPIESLPADYQQMRKAWDRLHLVRTLAGVISFGCYIVGAIAR